MQSIIDFLARIQARKEQQSIFFGQKFLYEATLSTNYEKRRAQIKKVVYKPPTVICPLTIFHKKNFFWHSLKKLVYKNKPSFFTFFDRNFCEQCWWPFLTMWMLMKKIIKKFFRHVHKRSFTNKKNFEQKHFFNDFIQFSNFCFFHQNTVFSKKHLQKRALLQQVR